MSDVSIHIPKEFEEIVAIIPSCTELWREWCITEGHEDPDTDHKSRTWAQLALSGQACFIVAYVGDDLAGYSFGLRDYDPRRRCSFICAAETYTRATCRGFGVGRELFLAADEWTSIEPTDYVLASGLANERIREHHMSHYGFETFSETFIRWADKEN